MATTVRKSQARKPSPRKTTPRKAVHARAAAAPAKAAPEVDVPAPPPGTADLANGLRTYLGAIDTEVRAVSALSERIDALVTELNDQRDQQAKRLLVLDELRASVTDASLGAFLDQAIKPRKTRVREVIPERLL